MKSSNDKGINGIIAGGLGLFVISCIGIMIMLASDETHRNGNKTASHYAHHSKSTCFSVYPEGPEFDRFELSDSPGCRVRIGEVGVPITAKHLECYAVFEEAALPESLATKPHLRLPPVKFQRQCSKVIVAISTNFQLRVIPKPEAALKATLQDFKVVQHGSVPFTIDLSHYDPTEHS